MFDHAAKVLASDYFFPLVFSVVMFAIWFIGRDTTERRRYQRATLIGAVAIGVANLVVDIIDSAYDRQRPFDELSDTMTLLFYRSTDPSFPANPMAVVFAIATAVDVRRPPPRMVAHRDGLRLLNPSRLRRHLLPDRRNRRRGHRNRSRAHFMVPVRTFETHPRSRPPILAWTGRGVERSAPHRNPPENFAVFERHPFSRAARAIPDPSVRTRLPEIAPELDSSACSMHRSDGRSTS